METKMKLSQFVSSGDSKSLAQIDGKQFTIVKVEDSNYEEAGETTKGVKITTKESFDVDGKEYNKFHTTRTAVVSKLSNPEIRKSLESGKEIGPIISKQVQSKSGRNYIDIIDAD